MVKNVLVFDRIIRFVLGLFLVAWAIGGGPAWAYVGFYLLASGSWGYCGIYSLLGIQPHFKD